MHDCHLENLIALEANLGIAYRDHSSLCIAGGEFDHDAVLSLLLAVRATLRSHALYGSEHNRITLAKFKPR